MLSVTPFLDHRNQDLWDQVNATFTIAIEHHNESSYGFYKINNQVTMHVPRSQPCQASFSHELLHLWMDLKDVSVSCTLSSTFKTDRLLKLLFKPELGDHLGNCADHYKMLPLYLQMGFEKERFLADYHNHKCSEIELSLIEGWYNNSDFGSRQYATEQYLAKYFAIKACPNPAFNYDAPLLRLNVVDNVLFNILESFWDKLREFDMVKSDPVFNSYRSFSYPFTEELKQHLVTKFSC